MSPWHVSDLDKPGKMGLIFKWLLCVNRPWAMKNFHTLEKYSH
jgi:hypothetical protein